MASGSSTSPAEAQPRSPADSDLGLLPLNARLHDTPLGALTQSLCDNWPALRKTKTCLATLVAWGWVLVLIYGGALYFWERSAVAAARSGLLRIRQELFQQSVRLGAGDLFLGQRQNSVELFVDKTEALAAGLTARWRAIPHAVLLLVVLLGTALLVDVWLALTAVLLTALSALVLGGLRLRSQRRAIYWEDMARQQRASLLEDLQHVRLLVNFAATAEPAGPSFVDRLRGWHAAALRQATADVATRPAVTTFLLAGVGLLLLLGGLNIVQQPPRLSIAGGVLLAASLGAASFPLWILYRYLQALPSAEQAANEIMAYLDRQPAVGQVPEARPLPTLKREIALAEVSLADARRQRVLDGLSLTIPAGSRTVVVASGGETPLALAGLLARFYDPTAGRILFDGHDIGRATLASLRAEVGLLLPDRVLVTGTVRENIACNEPRFSAVEVADAARQSLAYDVVQQLPQGFDTIVGEHGLRLSPPEQMLIGVARLMLRNPAVVILGELTEIFDPALEERLAAATNRLIAGRTVIVIARRIATLRAAERILFFHEGKLAADGTHAELLAESELYRHLNYVRFNEFRDKVKAEW